MADNLEGGRLRRKKRKIGPKDDEKGEGEAHDALVNVHTSAAPTYDFLHLASLILEWDIPILFPGSSRPRNSYAMLGAGGSFLVFREPRTMNEVFIRPDEVRSLADNMVLKRTRIHQLFPEAGVNKDAVRYASIMAELQILTDRSITEHENFIDLLGLTWDFEPNPDGTQSVWPVLALEAAECSMEALMHELRDAPLTGKIKYCHDVAKALDFLHERGVVHCDVKLENVLICVTSLSGSVAKLSDFGSALLDVNADTSLARGIVGTRPWNAPEYSETLRGLDIFKTDVFSYGMLLWRFIARSEILDELSGSQGGERESLLSNIEGRKRSDEFVQIAVEDAKSSYLDCPGSSDIVALLQATLTFQPTQRWSMAKVKTLLDNVVPQLSDQGDETGDEARSFHEQPEDPVDSPEASGYTNESISDDSQVVDARILPIPSVPFYNDFERFYERFEDEALELKQQLINSLKSWVNRNAESEFDAAEAAYQLSVCYFSGFGVQPDMNEGYRWTCEAAKLGSHKAQANVYKLSQATLSSQNSGSSDPQSIIFWLKQATALGSDQAPKDLRILDRESYAEAITIWRHRFCETHDAKGNAVIFESELLNRCQGLNSSGLDDLVLNDRGHRPIHLAASLGYTQTLQELLSRGVNINSQNTKGETALLCACRAGNADIALHLLRSGATIKRAKSGETPLHWLISFDDTEVEKIADELISSGARLEEQHLFTESNEYTFDTFPHGTPLDWAVSRREMAAIRVLVDQGADPFNECSEYSPFVRTVSLHDAEVLQLLLGSSHATPERLNGFDSTGQTLLFHAIYCNLAYLRIIQHGREVMSAARETIKTLLDSGCDPSCIDKDRTTIMHLAAGFCDAEFLEMLFENFNFAQFINAPCGEMARTPIHHAMASRKLEVVRLLISRGADTFCVSNGSTLLHLCAAAEDEAYSIQCLKALDLPHRSDLNALTIQLDAPQGTTAFEMAVLNCHLELAEMLLANGADPSGPEGREPSILSLLIADPAWDTPQALQYYLGRACCPFIVKTKNKLSALHVAASMQTYLADSFTGELKLELLLKTFSKHEQVESRTTSSEGSEVAGGQTPLHYAAKFGVYFAARRLLDVGACPNLVDDNGQTPLDLARAQLLDLKERVMPHEFPRVISELEDTVKLLGRAVESGPLPTRILKRRPSIGEHTRARFSKLGFQTRP